MPSMTMSRFLTLALIAVPLTLAAQTATSRVLTTVNGRPVPMSRFDQLIGAITRANQPRTPELETQVRDEVVRREIFMQEATRRGLNNSDEFRVQLELARQTLLIRTLTDDISAKNPVTDAEARADYDKAKAMAGGPVYNARHILVDTEAQARALITQLGSGASFEALAREHSKDTGSAASGGDLGFSSASAYVPEFSRALVALKKTEITQTPVRTQFGYHIIQLVDVRDATFPAFDEIKPQIVQRLKQERIADAQRRLISAARTPYTFAK